MKPLNKFPKPYGKLLRIGWVKPLSRNRHPNMTKNEHVCVIFCRPEVAGDVISGGNVKTTVEGYVVLHLKLIALVVSEKIKIGHLCNA